MVGGEKKILEEVEPRGMVREMPSLSLCYGASREAKDGVQATAKGREKSFIKKKREKKEKGSLTRTVLGNRYRAEGG